MDYETVRAAFFTAPEGVEVPAVMAAPSPARRLRDATEAIAMHAVWARPVAQVLAGHGLDFFGGYVWGRAASLGDTSGEVVAATFAAFDPTVMATVFETARTKVDRPTLLAELDRSVGASLAELVPAEAAEVGAVVAALRPVVEGADHTGKALFAGVRSLGWPDDPYAALWRACLALREFRGDAHVAVYVAAGLDPVRMNILTELWAGYPLGAYSGSRAWSPERTDAALAALRAAGWLEGDTITAAGRQARSDLEAATDRLCAPLADALGSAFDATVTTLAAWGEACVAAGAFPPDVRKLACG